jgi:serine/threonine protein kinase
MKTCPQCDTGYPDSHTTCPTHGVLLNEIRDLKPGMIIHQSYRIVRKLGQGGMGAVYLAQHTLMNEPQALKFLSSELSHDEAFTARFLREVRTLRQIRHKNVGDAGNLEPAEDGTLFFSMEFVDGPDLRAFLRNPSQYQQNACHPDSTNACHPERSAAESKDLRLPFGAFPVPLALSIARQIAEGLGAAHSKGMVHRDIKPENILMARDADSWLPKIADFGIVATKESSTAYTRTGGTLLTMAYAAPEQWRGLPAAELDGRTDLYALGGLLYEMLTGRSVFHAENYEGWSRQHQTTPPQPPSALRPDLANWQGLDALVLHLLAKDRNDRPKDVAELLALLDAVRLVLPEAHRETVAEYAGKRADKKSNRRLPRWVWITSASVVGLAIVIAGLAFSVPASTIAKRADELDKAHHYNLGGILRNLACTRGDGKACGSLARMYLIGPEFGVPRDSSRGVEFLSKACDAGNASSCSSLSSMYEHGRYVPPNPARAAEFHSRELALLTKACDAGDSASCSDLADMYHHGRGVAKDGPRAAALYSYACDAGNNDSCFWLAQMYRYADGVAEDDSRAAELDSKACSSGQAYSCGKLALCYEYGDKAIAKDYSEAWRLYNRACSLGDTSSCGKAETLPIVFNSDEVEVSNKPTKGAVR